MVPHTPLRRAIAAHMVRSVQTAPHGWMAVEMDMSPEAAKSLLYRARNQLRECLAGYMCEA